METTEVIKPDFHKTYTVFLELTAGITIITDSENRIQAWSEEANRRFTLEQISALGSHISDAGFSSILSPSEISVYCPDKKRDITLHKISLFGKDHYFHTALIKIKDADDGILSFVYNLTDKSYLIDRIPLCNVWKTVYSHTHEGVMITDEHNKIISVNRSFEQITGFSAAEVIGKNPSMLSSGSHSREFFNNMWKSILNNGIWKGEIYNKRKNGEVFPEWLTISVLKDSKSEIKNHIAIFSDISSFREKENKIYLSDYLDNLTGLPNRILMENRLQHMLFEARRTNKKVAVIFFNIHKFKKINNELGHARGDLLIETTARYLKNCIDGDDIMSRFNGDNFVIASCIDENETGIQKTEKIIQTFKAGVQLDGERIAFTPKIGICFYPDNAYKCDNLIKCAEIAMEHAKSEISGNYCIYTSDLSKTREIKTKIESGLRNGILENEFVVKYQPKYNLITGAAVGAEALIRWNNPEYSEISPGEFIAIAEESDLIMDIGSWVLENVLKQINDWLKRDRKMLRYTISVNASPIQLYHQRFIPELVHLLKKYNVPPEMLAFEITETTFIHNLNRMHEILTELRNMKIRICVDDFGTGYSSLSYLKKLPISSLKIDRSFILDVPGDENSKSIIEAIIEMAHKLELITVAEGVETAEQARFLLDADCDMAQGYYFAEALDPDNFFNTMQLFGAKI